MDEIAVTNRTGVAPPLPPKTRSKVSIQHDAPPAAVTGATVFVSPAPRIASQEVLQFSFPEVQGSDHANHSQITTTTVHTNSAGGHVVKIKINPENSEVKNNPNVQSSVVRIDQYSVESSGGRGASGSDPTQSDVVEPVAVGQPVLEGCIRINVGSSETDQLRDEMIQRTTAMTESFIKTSTERPNPYFFYSAFPCATSTMVMSSGQCSPSDTLDSGTCSDLDSTPPPLPKKKTSGVTVTVIGAQHKRASSLTSSGAEADSDDNDSNISCDSLNSSELNALSQEDNKPAVTKCPTPPALPKFMQDNNNANTFLPQGLLQDIRDRSAKLSQPELTSEVSQTNGEELTVETALPRPMAESCKAVIASSGQTVKTSLVDESTYEDRKIEENKKNQINGKSCEKVGNYKYEADKYYKFHLHENIIEEKEEVSIKDNQDEELFAGYKDILGCNASSTIRSAKGTVRGVKNRVRAGIATFLQINSTTKSYKEKDAGKVVVYTTTMGIVRNTYHQCLKVKQILRTHLVKFEERDVFMSNECQAEIRDRMHCDQILVPQVFVDGQHVGDAETIERLNESGELRRILKPYKSADACTTCQVCGGYRLLPCPVCNGSKKSVHRNHFTTEFVALKCMNCDEVGLVRCSSC